MNVQSKPRELATTDAREAALRVRMAESELASRRKTLARALVRASALGASVRDLAEATGLTYGRIGQIVREETRFPGE